jgi:hypothetical protein
MKMKYLILSSVLLASNAYAQNTCKTKKPCKITSKEVISESADDVNTPTPKELEGATIIVRTKDGKEHKMSAKTFKVVKRQQQYKNREKVILEKMECEPKVVTQVVTNTVTVVKHVKEKENKNLVMVGARYDYTHLNSGVSADGSTAYIDARRAMVFDVSYFRRRLFDSRIGAGIGIDTNATPRAMVGLEF